MTYRGQIKPSFGGVGRNVADCLTRLGANPRFLSVVGTDSYADMFFQHCSHMVSDFNVSLNFTERCSILQQSTVLQN